VVVGVVGRQRGWTVLFLLPVSLSEEPSREGKTGEVIA
jgi:hypothetical protein